MIVEKCCWIHMVTDRCQWINFCHLTGITWAWERIWRVIDLRFSPIVAEGWRFPVRVNLWPLCLVPTDEIIKYIKKPSKRPNNNKNGRVMRVWASSVFKNFAFEKFWSAVSSVVFSSTPSAASGNKYLSSVELFWQGNNGEVPSKWSFKKTYGQLYFFHKIFSSPEHSIAPP